jgi:hypothetical protein
MSPEQDKSGRWFVALPDGSRIEFESNAAAWRWIDRQERRPSWSTARMAWRLPLLYDEDDQ